MPVRLSCKHFHFSKPGTPFSMTHTQTDPGISRESSLWIASSGELQILQFFKSLGPPFQISDTIFFQKSGTPFPLWDNYQSWHGFQRNQVEVLQPEAIYHSILEQKPTNTYAHTQIWKIVKEFFNQLTTTHMRTYTHSYRQTTWAATHVCVCMNYGTFIHVLYIHVRVSRCRCMI